MKFSIRQGNIELRSCDQNLLQVGVHTTAEIICLEGNHNYTIAHWRKNKDNFFDLVFVGTRPFDEKIDSGIFMELAKTGQNLLEYFQRTEEVDKSL